MNRTEKITALLASLFDYLPGPKTARYGDLPGPAPTTTGLCKSCGGVGTFGKKQRPCAACEGKGTVSIDAYTGEPVGTEGQRIQVSSRARIDSELAKLAHDEAIRRGRLLDDPFAWEAERIRYRQAGSYASLERALERLRANEPDLASLVMRCMVYGTVEPGEQASAHLERALEWLSARMPPEIRVPRWVSEGPVERPDPQWGRGGRGSADPRAREQRDAQIVQLSAAGSKQAEIAAQVGVSTATVSRVLKAVSLAGTAA